MVGSMFKYFPRLFGWLFVALLLLIGIALLSPQQLPVTLYKISLITLAAGVGYWLDRALFPYARPDGYLNFRWKNRGESGDYNADHPIADGYSMVFALAMLRRALIVAAVVLAVALGL